MVSLVYHQARNPSYLQGSLISAYFSPVSQGIRRTDWNFVCFCAPLFDVEKCAWSIWISDIWSTTHPFSISMRCILQTCYGHTTREDWGLPSDIFPRFLLISHLHRAYLENDIRKTTYDNPSGLVAIMYPDNTLIFQSPQILRNTQDPLPLLIPFQRGRAIGLRFNNIIIMFSDLPLGPIVVKGG
jgi:hypothetical protein